MLFRVRRLTQEFPDSSLQAMSRWLADPSLRSATFRITVRTTFRMTFRMTVRTTFRMTVRMTARMTVRMTIRMTVRTTVVLYSACSSARLNHHCRGEGAAIRVTAR